MHRRFILSSPLQILREGIFATAPIGDDMRLLAAAEYIMQSIFIKLTGYQEQKCKLILWDLGCFNNEIRYDLMRGGIPIKEGSNLTDKTTVLSKIIETAAFLEIKIPDFETDTKKAIIEDTYKEYYSLISESMFAVVWPRELVQLESYGKVCLSNANSYLDQLLMIGDEKIKMAYDQTYNHRNRCAHNLLSYQENVPTLAQRRNDANGTDNYFCMIFNLLLIDKAFTTLYKCLLEGIE